MLVILPLSIYWQVIPFEFINLDDNRYILDNPFVYQGLTWTSIKWAWITFADPYYMPLTRLSYLLEAEIYGVDQRIFHFTNLLLHIINTFLVLYLFWRLSGKWIICTTIAVLFCIHPQHVEAVVWIAQRKELLSALFGLLSLIFYVQYAAGLNQKPKAGVESTQLAYLLALLFYLFSLLSKPTWITFPILLLLLDWWPLQVLRKRQLMKVLLNKGPFLLLTLLFCTIHLFSAGTGAEHIVISSQLLSFWQQIANAFVIYLVYFYKTFLPVQLGGYHPYPLQALPLWQYFLSILSFVGICLLVFQQRFTRPYLLSGWAWFVVALSPMVGVIGIGESVFTGDRWTYMPHLGLFMALAWILAANTAILERHPKAALTIALVVVLSLSASSWQLSGYWRNSEVFWLRSLAIADNNHYAHRKLAAHYQSKGDINKAFVHYVQAHRIHPAEPYYALELGNLFFLHGEPEKAWSLYRKLLNSAPAGIDLLAKMGVMAISNNEYQHAADFFSELLKREPESMKERDFHNSANLYRGFLLVTSGKYEEARHSFETFIEYFAGNRDTACAVALSKLIELKFKKGTEESIELLAALCS